ncbi:hypothetical protein ACJZD2_29490 [Klebsiella pneumoniae]|uniref:hypothetical protein n=1 Tax=Klebsiella pneumoniae TaxID=573 RepID=UPI00397085B8
MRRNAQKWIPFGFDTDSNKIVDIASVENGLSCNCICLICGTSLMALLQIVGGDKLIIPFC